VKQVMHCDAPVCTWRFDSAHAATTEDQVTAHAIVPPAIVARLASICLGLPEACEEQAWAGTRWSIRKKNFAHVLMIDAGWPPAYAQAAGSNGPAIALTFRLPVSRLDAPRFARTPFFRPVWFPDIAGMLIDARVDWDEVADLLTESYCLLAPKKLVALVDRADG
jgi:hypothetical protein